MKENSLENNEEEEMIKKNENENTNTNKNKKKIFSKKFETQTMCEIYCWATFCLFLIGFFYLVFGYVTSFRKDELSNLIQKPLNDKKIYKYLNLNNDMTILLIHNNNSKISSLNLEISHNYYSDLFNVPYFAARMMFKKSKKKMKFNNFEDFLNEINGKIEIIEEPIETKSIKFKFSFEGKFMNQALKVYIYFFF